MSWYWWTSKERLPSTLESEFSSFLQAYDFYTPTDHPLPHDIKILLRQLKKHGYLIGRRARSLTSMHPQAILSGPPDIIKIDERGTIYLRRSKETGLLI